MSLKLSLATSISFVYSTFFVCASAWFQASCQWRPLLLHVLAPWGIRLSLMNELCLTLSSYFSKSLSFSFLYFLPSLLKDVVKVMQSCVLLPEHFCKHDLMSHVTCSQHLSETSLSKFYWNFIRHFQISRLGFLFYKVSGFWASCFSKLHSTLPVSNFRSKFDSHLLDSIIQ